MVEQGSPPAAKTFQPPKGTRDFYPADMAVRRSIESIWRQVSINHGFEEIEGPTFEHLDLYTVKSGEGIVSELFQAFSGKDEAERERVRATGQAPFALRPEFTPTLARMYAARASSLPSPTKWFCIPNHFRAERPQRGRLREFIQWNADIVGDDSPAADAEIVAVTIGILQALGLKSSDATVKISHRGLIGDALRGAGVGQTDLEAAMNLLDRRAKLNAPEFDRQCAEIGLDHAAFETTTTRIADGVNQSIAALEKGDTALRAGDEGGAGLRAADQGGASLRAAAGDGVEMDLAALFHHLAARRILHWCEFDPSIVRGLAYYTGTVFEVVIEGERAIAGGGRYDKLIELFGGPPTPAVGIAMGDVVLRLVLEDKGLLGPAEAYLPRPDVFVINARDEGPEVHLTPLVARLRAEGLHVRQSYRATRNVGKLLKEAARCRAALAIILGGELDEGKIVLKNLETGTQDAHPLEPFEGLLQSIAAQRKPA